MEPETQAGTPAAPETPAEPVSQPPSPPAPYGPPAPYYPPTWLAAAPAPFPPPAAPPRRSRGRVLIAAGAALSIAIGAGIGTYIVKQREHRNDQAIAAAEAAQAAIPAPVTGGVRFDGSHYGSLFAYLLPIPAGYDPGPDDGTYGDDSYSSAAQVTTQLEDLLSGIPKSDLSSAKGVLANTHLKGVAVRTLQSSASESTVVVSIELLQFDVKDAKSAADDFDSLVSDLNVFRLGPPVPGYGGAKCVLPPGLGSDKVDEMLCVASGGDVEVIVDAQGTAPLDMNSIATLVARQLDRLKTSQNIDR